MLLSLAKERCNPHQCASWLKVQKKVGHVGALHVGLAVANLVEGDSEQQPNYFKSVDGGWRTVRGILSLCCHGPIAAAAPGTIVARFGCRLVLQRLAMVGAQGS